VIKTFADRRTKELYDSGKSKRFPPGVWERALRKLEYLDLATSVNDLKLPPSNRLHKWSEIGLDSIRFPLTTNGEYAFDLKMAMRTTLR
jgi:plasmid maintenance system killer protein